MTTKWKLFPPGLLQLLGLSIPCSAFQLCQPIKSLLSAQELLSLGIQQDRLLGSPKNPG